VGASTDLRRYTHIVALAEEASFGAAAERVHLSQPAFSRSIQAAETELGMELFVRGGKRILCTPAGSFVVERLRALLQASANLRRDVGMFREGMVGDLYFGMGTFLAVAFLPSLLADMRGHYPSVRLRAVVHHPMELLEQLRRHELEFVLIDRRFAPADLHVEALLPIPAHYYVREGHPLLARKTVRMKDIATYGLATSRIPPPVQEALRRGMGLAEDEEVPLAVQCDDSAALKAVTLATDAIMPATYLLLEHELATGALRQLPVQDMPEGLESQPSIVSELGRRFSPAGTYALQFIRSTALAAQEHERSPPQRARRRIAQAARRVAPEPVRPAKQKLR
jgi:DNA-binding transcriptional LysR family regulator